MFEEPGRKMKRFAVVFFWLEIVGTVILAYIFGDAGRYFDFLIFFGILIAGFGSAYFFSLILYGAGEAIEDLSDCRTLLRQTASEVKAPEKNKEAGQAVKAAAKEGTTVKIPSSIIRCPRCGAGNMPDRVRCWSCGEDL